jgi:hypothetical protein
MEQCCVPLAVEFVPRKHCISALNLPRLQDFNLPHAKRGSFLIIEQSCGLLSVETFTGKQESTAISALFLPRNRELCLAHAQSVSFLIT